MRIYLSFALASLVACGGGGSATIDGPGGGGGGGGIDAEAIDAAPGPPITITGTAESEGATGTKALANVTIGAYHETATTPTVMTTSAADGTYTLMVPTENGSVDGYVKGTITGYVDTYLYPPAPLTMDTPMANVLMVTSGTYGLLYTLARVSQTDGDGTIAVEVVNGTTGATVVGATVTSTPSYTVKYNSGGFPSMTATATDTDGVAYIMNVPPGSVSVTATATGLTIPAHDVTVRVPALTTTEIVGM